MRINFKYLYLWLIFSLLGGSNVAQNVRPKGVLLHTWQDSLQSIEARLMAGTQLVEEHYLRNHSDSTLFVLKQLKTLASQSKRATFYLAKIYYLNGDWYEQQSLPRQQELCIDKALRLLKQDTHEAFILYLDLQISKAYCIEHNRQDKAGAIQHLIQLQEEVLERYPAEGARQAESLWYLEFTLGNMYGSSRDFVRAKRYYLHSFQHNNSYDLRVSPSIFTGLSVLYQSIGQADSARYYLEAGIKKAIAQDNWRAKCTLYLLKGTDFSTQGQLDSAEHYLKLALGYGERLQWSHRNVSILTQLGRLAMQKQAWEKAENYYQQAYRVATSTGQYENKIVPCKSLYELYKARKNYTKALQYHEEYKRWADSIAHKTNNLTLARAEATHELNLLKKGQEAKLDRANLFLIVGGVGIAFLIGVLLVITRLYLERQKVTKMLEASNAQLRTEQVALSKSYEQLERFAHSISHDIVANLDLMLSTGNVMVSPRRQPEELVQYYESTRDISQSLKNYCLNLLLEVKSPLVAKVSAPVDPMPTLQQVLQQLAPAIQQAGVAVLIQPLPPLVLPPAIVEKVFFNLITNVLQHGASSKEPKISIHADQTQEGWVVEDNGSGIPTDERNAIFTTHNTGYKKRGLRILKETLNAYGAEIRAEESTMGGARFVVMQVQGGFV